MKYDPIICMMIDDSVKTKDEVPNGWKVTLEKNRNKQYVYSKAMTARGAELEAKKEYPDATVLNVERHNISDKKTIDKAIRSCDRVTVKYDDAIGDTHTFSKNLKRKLKSGLIKESFLTVLHST